ncbi:MAG: HAD family phosphatase [Armatimonadetes bacterium]|nr:HAD family phosphatase [Armatimonadota bacterium]
MTDQGVIFDLDGVLVDSSALHLESWRIVGAERGFTMTEALFRETFGMPNAQIFVRLFGHPLPEEEARELSERKEAVYRELAVGRLEALPGVVPLLRALRAEGFRLALGSSTPMSNIRVILDAIGVRECFDAVVCADDVTHGKPHPEVFLKAAERIGVPPECCVVVEDALVGVQAAKAAGMRCLAVTTTHPRERLQEADRVVDHLTEVTPADFRALLAPGAAR